MGDDSSPQHTSHMLPSQPHSLKFGLGGYGPMGQSKACSRPSMFAIETQVHPLEPPHVQVLAFVQQTMASGMT